jgi:two-component system, LuxR family, sensor kinase FixL
MDWITLIWSAIATVYFTLAMIHFMIFLDHRTERWQLVFTLCSLSAATLAICELLVITVVQNAYEYTIVARVAQVALSTMIVTASWFLSYFLEAGRRWLKITLTAARVFMVFSNVIVPEVFGLGIITSFEREPIFNGSIPAVKYAFSPWQFIGTITIVGFMIFSIDATITAWRRGDRKTAIRVGGSASLFYLLVLSQAVYLAGVTGAPIISVFRYPLYSVFFMAVILAMSFELSRAVFRAVTIARELRENETRVSLAADSAGVGLWSRNMKSGKSLGERPLAEDVRIRDERFSCRCGRHKKYT